MPYDNDQMIVKQRTVGELIAILQQYPPETPISGVSNKQHFSDFCTVQGNCPDGELNNVGIYFWDKDEVKEDEHFVGLLNACIAERSRRREQMMKDKLIKLLKMLERMSDPYSIDPHADADGTLAQTLISQSQDALDIVKDILRIHDQKA